jgi:signal transduction histidine kinase
VSHPILGVRSRLGAYLAAWLPLSAVPYLVLAEGTAPLAALALAVPLTLLYAFIGLSTWYLCRAAPLGPDQLWRSVGAHALSALVAGVLWVQAAKALAAAVGTTIPSLDPGLIAGSTSSLYGIAVLFYLLSVTFHYALIAYQRSAEAERREILMRVQAREAELRSLRAQLGPHFLFNCLNAISALTTSDPEGARRMCIHLSELLRRTQRLGGSEMVTLDEELSLVRDYLALEKIRFGERLRVEETIDDRSLAAPIPPLLLQPLVENAVTHGISTAVEGGTIEIATRCGGGRVEIRIANPSPETSTDTRGSGVGRAIVERRLRTAYGTEASFSAESSGGRYHVRVGIPLDREQRT